MKIGDLHDWNLDPKGAVALQRELAPQLISDTPIALDRIKSIAGVDVSVRRKRSRAAVVVMRYPQLDTIEIARAEREASFPYIPGLLAFREGPVILDALRQLQCDPDAFIFDGMGQIHPRKMGIAAHLGLWLQRPTIGCGKTHFIGEFVEPASEKGSSSALHHRDEQIGAVLRTRARVKPVYVSVGHLADLASAVKLILSATTRYRLPEPVRAAHNAARL
ncbi:MAG: endonuclease V [Chloroflexi bacterium]|nr:endonuclease V [Chloroflexota bacterium]